MITSMRRIEIMEREKCVEEIEKEKNGEKEESTGVRVKSVCKREREMERGIERSRESEEQIERESIK